MAARDVRLVNRRVPRHSFVIDALAISSSTPLSATLRLASMLRQEEGCAGEVVDARNPSRPVWRSARGSTWSRPSAQLPPSFQGHFAPFPRIISSASLMPVHGGETSAMSTIVLAWREEVS
jgi:hypothetical protein